MQVTKTEKMDQYIEVRQDALDAETIRQAISRAFAVDVNKLSDKEGMSFDTVIASLLDRQGREVKGSEIRNLINERFGANLDALSGLEGSGVSIYSKGQWMTRDEKGLFVIRTDLKDIEASVYPTEYYKEKTGKAELPAHLVESLTKLGYTCQENLQCCQFREPGGKAVKDEFKGRTVGALLEAIKKDFTG